MWNESRIRLKFKGSCLKENKENKAFTLSKVNLFVLYEVDTWSRDLNADFTLKDCLSVAVKLTKNANQDKYKYSCYNKGLDSRSEFSFTDGSMKKMSLFSEQI